MRRSSSGLKRFRYHNPTPTSDWSAAFWPSTCSSHLRLQGRLSVRSDGTQTKAADSDVACEVCLKRA